VFKELLASAEKHGVNYLLIKSNERDNGKYIDKV